jgi:hypothetical protein
VTLSLSLVGGHTTCIPQATVHVLLWSTVLNVTCCDPLCIAGSVLMCLGHPGTMIIAVLTSMWLMTADLWSMSLLIGAGADSVRHHAKKGCTPGGLA